MADVHSRQAAGIIFVKVDGEQIEANGEFTYRISGGKREYHMNSNGKGGGRVHQGRCHQCQ